MAAVEEQVAGTSSSLPERSVAPAEPLVCSPSDVERMLRRIAHEILERNRGGDGLVVLGIERGGTPIAVALGRLLGEIEGTEVPVGSVDPTSFRDDLKMGAKPLTGARPVGAVGGVTTSTTSTGDEVEVEVERRVVVLVDDVVQTGRTARAAIDAVGARGRARAIQLAALVDRGHRELPIRADYVGKNLPTRADEVVEAGLSGVAIRRRRNTFVRDTARSADQPALPPSERR